MHPNLSAQRGVGFSTMFNIAQIFAAGGIILFRLVWPGQ
jgi:hypothetical protein